MAKKTKEPAVEIPKVKKAKTVDDYYSVGKWKGLNQYKCNLCPFDSLSEQAIKNHIIDRHFPKPVKPAVKPKIYDRFNNEIK